MPDTTKGMFFTSTLDVIAARLGRDYVTSLRTELGLPDHYSAFSNYPIQPLVRLQRHSSPQLFPGLDANQGMFEWGRLSFDTFADSTFGKVALTLLVNNLRKLGERVPSFYSMTNGFGEVSTHDVSDRGFRIVYRGYKHYPANQHGLIQAGVERLVQGGKVELQVRSCVEGGTPGDVTAEFEIAVRA